MSKREIKIPVWLIIALLFVSFLPFIGGGVAIILIIIRIFYYKNKWLWIIGIIGLIGLSQYIMVYYYSTHRGPFDNPRKQLAHERLRQLIGEIELFKASNGYYPKNLQDLPVDSIETKDPVQYANPGKDHHFYYKVSGQKYFFFSKGFDGEPFTKDDIYPSLSGINSNNIGIIIDSAKSL
jgi:hypothetical protein